MSGKIGGYIRQHHLALVAIFLALTGTAYAVDGPLPGQNQVGSQDIINGEVKTEDIRDANVTRHDLGPDSVLSAKVLDNSLTGADVANDSLQGADVDEGSLNGALIPGLANSSGVVKVDDDPGDLDATVEPLLSVGPFTLNGVCTDLGASGRSGEVRISSSVNNWSGDSDADSGADEFRDASMAFTYTLAGNGFSEATTEKAIDVGDYAAAAPRKLLAGEVLAGVNIMGTDCVFGVTGIG